MLVGKQTPRKNVQLVNPPSENTTHVKEVKHVHFACKIGAAVDYFSLIQILITAKSIRMTDTYKLKMI